MISRAARSSALLVPLAFFWLALHGVPVAAEVVAPDDPPPPKTDPAAQKTEKKTPLSVEEPDFKATVVFPGPDDPEPRPGKSLKPQRPQKTEWAVPQEEGAGGEALIPEKGAEPQDGPAGK
ncbi:MAG: hypothetical protein NTW87_36140, partial [Planctomycetota bacterium]|nr:hypothetical protein [Planctomycetota bacterium]